MDNPNERERIPLFQFTLGVLMIGVFVVGALGCLLYFLLDQARHVLSPAERAGAVLLLFSIIILSLLGSVCHLWLQRKYGSGPWWRVLHPFDGVRRSMEQDPRPLVNAETESDQNEIGQSDESGTGRAP